MRSLPSTTNPPSFNGWSSLSTLLLVVESYLAVIADTLEHGYLAVLVLGHRLQFRLYHQTSSKRAAPRRRQPLKFESSSSPSSRRRWNCFEQRSELLNGRCKPRQVRPSLSRRLLRGAQGSEASVSFLLHRTVYPCCHCASTTTSCISKYCSGSVTSRFGACSTCTSGCGIGFITST